MDPPETPTSSILFIHLVTIIIPNGNINIVDKDKSVCGISILSRKLYIVVKNAAKHSNKLLSNDNPPNSNNRNYNDKCHY